MLRPLLTTLTLLALAPIAGADCLDELQNAAKSQRTCQVNQSRSDECDGLIKQTTVITQRCQAMGKRNSQTTFAIQEGFQSVLGDPAMSPWQVSVRREREKNALLEEDRRRWTSNFGKLLSAARQDRFDENNCPLAYAGKGDRFIFISSFALPVKRDLSIQIGNQREDVTHLYFTAMQADRCYGIRSPLQTARMEVDQTDFVYNLTESDLNSLAQLNTGSFQQSTHPVFHGQLKIHVCKNAAECITQKIEQEQRWSSYSSAVQHSAEDETCISYSSEDRSGEIDLNKLYNRPCKPELARQHLKEHQETMSKLEPLLF